MGGSSVESLTSATSTTTATILAAQERPTRSQTMSNDSSPRSLRSVKGRLNLRSSIPPSFRMLSLDSQLGESSSGSVQLSGGSKQSPSRGTLNGFGFGFGGAPGMSTVTEVEEPAPRSRLGHRGVTPDTNQSDLPLAPRASTSGAEHQSRYLELSSKERRRKRKEKLNSPLPPTPPAEEAYPLPTENPTYYDRLYNHDVASLASSSATNVSASLDSVLSGVTLRPEKYRPEKIYSHLHRLAEREISKVADGSTDTDSTLSCPDSEIPVGAVPGIIQSRKYRDKLSEMLSRLSNGSKVYEAIIKDEPQVANLIKIVLTSTEEKKAALALKDHDAEFFMDALQDVLDNGLCFTEEELRHDARRLLVDLSKSSTNLPESMFIVGVEPVKEKNAYGGTFGDVYRSSYEGKSVALKRLRNFEPSERLKIYRKFCKEALIWQRLSCQFVLPFLGIDAENFPRQPCMVSPWMVNGTINQFLKRNPKVNIDKLLFEIAQGIDHLHSQGIVHGDIKGGNILIDERCQPRLADFGLTIFADATHQNTTDQGGTLRWMAPELLYPIAGVESYKRSFASDLYAYGCLCVEVYTGDVPFADIRPEVLVLERVIKGDRPRRPSGPNTMTDDLWELVKACWYQNCDLRPKSREVVDCLKHILRRSATDPSVLPPPSQWQLPKIHSGSSSSSLSTARSISLFNQTLTPEEVRNRQHFEQEAALYRCLKRIRRHADPARMYHDLKVLRQNFSVKFSVARVKDTNTKVAIKQLEIFKLKERTLSQLVDEFHDMRFLHHPNLINYIDLFQYENQVWVVLDDVIEPLYLRKVIAANLHKDLGLKERFIGTVLKNVGQAVHYLHRHHISHGNINAEQVLLSYAGKSVLVRLKLCAMIADPDSAPRARKRAPGTNSNDTEARFQADVWDLGLLAVEMFDSSGTLDLESDRFLEELAASNPAPSAPLLGFITRATKEDLSERPSIADLLKDPFLKRIA